MENIQTYENPEFGKFRTLLINGEPWFIGKEIAKVLGYAETANMRKLLEKEEYAEINPQSPDFKGFVQNGVSLEPNPNIFRMLLVNESGLYNAIFNSTLPKAKKFKRWVTSEVLPSIRKTGSYGVPKMSAMEMIAQLAENAVKTERILTEHTERINDLEEKTDVNIQGVVREALTYATLTFEQQKYIQVKVALKVFDLCPEYDDYKANKEKLFNKIYNDIRKRYNVSSFRNVRARDFEDTLKFINNWTVKKS